MRFRDITPGLNRNQIQAEFMFIKARYLNVLNPEDLVGKTEICSECGKQKKIQLALDQAPDKQGVTQSPYMKCEDCVSSDLEKDENK